MTNNFELEVIRKKKEVVGLRIKAKRKDDRSLIFCGILYFSLCTRKTKIQFGKKNNIIINYPPNRIEFKKTKKVFEEIKKIVNNQCTVKALYCALEITKN